jgi:hypothetical protein
LPDRRAHRGPDPRDRHAFDPSTWPALREAVADLSWLLGRGYAEPSALKLVGDRLSLTERQRAAVRRCACTGAALLRRRQHRRSLDMLRGGSIHIDGFNVLTTIESALGGGVVLVGRDGCYRDLAGVHGTYRKVEETRPALLLLGKFLADRGLSRALWYLDSPVSNSGRLKGEILEAAREKRWRWEVELVFNPDPILIHSEQTVATADSAILDRCAAWVSLARAVVEAAVPGAFVVDLGCG